MWDIRRGTDCPGVVQRVPGTWDRHHPSPLQITHKDKEQGFPSSQVRCHLQMSLTWCWNALQMYSVLRVGVGDVLGFHNTPDEKMKSGHEELTQGL